MAEDEAPLLASPPDSPTRLSHEFVHHPPPKSGTRRCLPRRRRTILLSTVILVIFVTLFFAFVSGPSAADLRWIATSPSALDRFACRWGSICGILNWWRYEEPAAFGRPEDLEGPVPDFSQAWVDSAIGPHPEDSWSVAERAAREIPPYVLDYAPYVFLHDEERYWPSDSAEHLAHSTVALGEEQNAVAFNLSLAGLDELNALNGSAAGHEAYLVAEEDPETRPEWMLSRVNRPDDAGRSRAPAVLICVPKPDDTLDAFWFFFYSFNEGNTVFGTRYGNHIGDWEHTMVRFRQGKPQALYLSRHSWGSTYHYDTMEKDGQRPIVYSANGSHAHYPAAGDQPYVLPLGILKDVTSQGARWDPALHFYAYTYAPIDKGSGIFRTATRNPRAATGWLAFTGHWGDARYPLGDSRQYRFFGETHFGSGPTGPRDKRLERKGLCDTAKCKGDGPRG